MFENFISIEGESDSGYSLFDLDITTDDLNDMVGRAYADGEALGLAKIAFAYKEVANDVLLKIHDDLRVSSVLQNERIGYPHEDRSMITPEANKLKGIYVGFERTDAFLNFTINTIRLSIDTAGPYDVVIWDAMQNKALKTIPVTAVANELVTVSVNETFATNRGEFKIAVLYNPAGAESVQTTVNPNGCLTCSHIGKHRNIYLESKAVNISVGTEVLYNNLKSKQETGGLSIDYTISCDHLGWVASNRKILAPAMLYKAGAAIARYAIHGSNRVNSTTNIDAESWDMRLADFEKKYSDHITAYYRGLRLPSNNCFCHSPRISTKTML